VAPRPDGRRDARRLGGHDEPLGLTGALAAATGALAAATIALAALALALAAAAIAQPAAAVSVAATALAAAALALTAATGALAAATIALAAVALALAAAAIAQPAAAVSVAATALAAAALALTAAISLPWGHERVVLLPDRRVRPREQHVAGLQRQWQHGDAVGVRAGRVAQGGARCDKRGAGAVRHHLVSDLLWGRHQERVHCVLGHAVHRGRQAADSERRRRKLAARPSWWRFGWHSRGGALRNVEHGVSEPRQPEHELVGHVRKQRRVAAEAGERS
jgi:hypothetical protein